MHIWIERGEISIGERCFFNHYCSICSINGSIKIGNDCLIGENVKIYDNNHRFRVPYISIKEQGFTSSEIVIGDNCWIGSNSVILKGAKIGNNCVIGAGCIVADDIPDDSILTIGACHF